MVGAPWPLRGHIRTPPIDRWTKSKGGSYVRGGVLIQTYPLNGTDTFCIFLSCLCQCGLPPDLGEGQVLAIDVSAAVDAPHRLRDFRTVGL